MIYCYVRYAKAFVWFLWVYRKQGGRLELADVPLTCLYTSTRLHCCQHALVMHGRKRSPVQCPANIIRQITYLNSVVMPDEAAGDQEEDEEDGEEDEDDEE